jgi:hypothetical protein
MEIRSYGRYGDLEKASGPKAVEKLIRERVAELCSEQFARPDYEHYQVSVGRPDGWSITAYMMGPLTLYRLDSGEPARYLDGPPREELVELLLQLARGEMEAVLARPWTTDRGAVDWERDFYLFASSPGWTDLHRAAAKGDLEWIDSELAGGADVNGADGEGATPLHRAALAGQAEACRRLLAAGADPNATDADDEPVWEYACLSREHIGTPRAEELVRLLKEAAGEV